MPGGHCEAARRLVYIGRTLLPARLRSGLQHFLGLVEDHRGFAGQTVLICWNHENIPDLMAALGNRPTPNKWKAQIFDRVYRISDQRGKASLAKMCYGEWIRRAGILRVEAVMQSGRLRITLEGRTRDVPLNIGCHP